MRFFTVSQWRSCKMGVIILLLKVTNRAAAFWIHCSLLIWKSGMPCKTLLHVSNFDETKECTNFSVVFLSRYLRIRPMFLIASEARRQILLTWGIMESFWSMGGPSNATRTLLPTWSVPLMYSPSPLHSTPKNNGFVPFVTFLFHKRTRKVSKRSSAVWENHARCACVHSEHNIVVWITAGWHTSCENYITNYSCWRFWERKRKQIIRCFSLIFYIRQLVVNST